MKRAAFAAGSTCLAVLIAYTPRLKWSAIQYLRYMNVFEIELGPPRDTLLMHQTGHVRRNHVFGSVAKMIVGLVHPHPGRHGFVCHAESTAKTAAVIRPIYRHQDQALHL